MKNILSTKNVIFGFSVIFIISLLITYNNIGEFNLFYFSGLTLSSSFLAYLVAFVLKEGNKDAENSH